MDDKDKNVTKTASELSTFSADLDNQRQEQQSVTQRDAAEPHQRRSPRPESLNLTKSEPNVRPLSYLSSSSVRTSNSSVSNMAYDSDGFWPPSHGDSGPKINVTQGSATKLNDQNLLAQENVSSSDRETNSSIPSENGDHRSNPEYHFTIGPEHESMAHNMIYVPEGSQMNSHGPGHPMYDLELNGDDEDEDDEEDEDRAYDPFKQVIVGICAMEKKAQSKPMKEILRRLEDYFEYIKTLVFEESVILNKPIDEWPLCDCLISFHSKGFPLSKAIEYARLRRPFLVNDLDIQYDIQDRRKVYKILEEADIELPRYAVLDRDSANPEDRELIESDDHIEVANFVFNKPFVEKPISAEDHNICIYYPAHAGGGSQRLFRKIGCRSSVYSNESHVRKTGSFIYEEFMPTDGTDVKVYTAGPDYAHAEARKSPALDGKVERDMDGKEIRYPVILTNREKMIARKVCLAFKQTVCGFDLLRANGRSYVCDVNGFSFVKSSMKYYEDCSKILGNMMLRALAPQLHIPWSIPFQLDDPPIVPTTFGRMMELRCVIAVIRHGDRTPKQKMKLEVKHNKFFDLYHKYGNTKNGQAKLKKPKQLQEVLDIARYLLGELPDQPLTGEVVEPRVKLKQLKSVLEMYGHFSGINRKVQLKYQPHGRPRRSSSEDEVAREPSLVLILKWGGELTPAGRVQAEDLGRCFRRLYPASGDYSGPQGLGLLRLHSTFRHDLKIYASDEGRVQMTAAAFAKGFLALEGELTPILFQMVKSANTNGLLDNDCDSSKCQKIVKERLHDIMQKNHDLTGEDMEILNPTDTPSIEAACKFIGNPYQACEKVYKLIKELNTLIKSKRQDNCYTQEYHLYHGETWDLLQRRWAKLEKDFKFPRSKRFDISKIPDIYDCIKYDLQHNQHTLQFQFAHELHTYAKALADIVIPQEYGMTAQEKLMISLGTCSPLLRKIQADLLRNADSSNEDDTESVNRLDPKYSHGVSSPDRHVRTRLYFTSESHIHSLITALQYGGLLNVKQDEQWQRSMEFLSAISELNYLSQIVIMLYEDPTKEPTSDDRFHIEIHFSSGVISRISCSQKNMPTEPQGPGFRPHLHNKSFSTASSTSSGGSAKDATPNADANRSRDAATMIKEEATDDERWSTSDGGESRGHSKSSSVCISPQKSNNHSPGSPSDQLADTKQEANKSPTNSVATTEESDAENNQTLTQANAHQLALKSQPQSRSLSRSYSATTPVSLKDLFKQQTSADSSLLTTTEEPADGQQQEQETTSKVHSEKLPVCETEPANVNDSAGKSEKCRKAQSDRQHSAEEQQEEESSSSSLTPTVLVKDRWQTYEQYLASELAGTVHLYHGGLKRRHNRYQAPASAQPALHQDQQQQQAKLISLPPTYHTIHHWNLSPSALSSIKRGQNPASMSTSPQQLGASNTLHQRFLAYKHQQAGGKHQYFTMSASMPIQYKSSQNPRACSVADVSQYCGGPSSLISTAVISGSSPELVAVCPYSPNIRPLETLHNELSLRQFIDFITRLTRNHRCSTNCHHHDGARNSSGDQCGYNSISQQQQQQPTEQHRTSSNTSQARNGNQPASGAASNSCGPATGNRNQQAPHTAPMGLSPGNSLSNSLIWSGPPSSFASSPGPSSPSAAIELWSKLELEESGSEKEQQ